jgi:hypothetical protein
MNKPNPESKTSRIILQALAFDEKEKIVAFKKLCRQDGITEKDMMLEALDLLFVKHRLHIGGNPQTQVDSPLFTGEVTQVYPPCKCGKVSAKHGLHLASKREYDFCKKCFSNIVGRYDVKLWSWKEDTAKK